MGLVRTCIRWKAKKVRYKRMGKWIKKKTCAKYRTKRGRR